MPDVQVERLTFRFPGGWTVSKYDEWVYYRKRFACMWDEIKAVDLLAVEDDHTAWFIEVKDYRLSTRTKPTELADEIARKVFDTLAAMLPAAANANDPDEQRSARAVCHARQLRVVLHLEQPAKHSVFRPRAIDPAVVKRQMKALLKPIDAHPMVVESTRMNSLAWSVT